MAEIFNVELFTATVRMMTPLALAALGALIVWRAGIINMAIEGFMLIGALSATLGTIVAGGSPLAGLVIALVVTALFGFGMAVAIAIFGANQIVVGIAFNIGAIGLTDYAASVAPGMLGVRSLHTAVLPSVPVPLLSHIPWLGPILFDQGPLFYVAVVAAVAMAFILSRTGIGITLRAVGEHARAADTAGIVVSRVRLGTYMVSALFAGLAGAFLSIGDLGSFISNMSAGQGYIALVVVILGQWRPLGALSAATLFGFAQALTIRWPNNATVFPIEVVSALPYVLTLFVVAVAGKAKGPAEEGLHYVRER
jgi:general nucleoside transport system permease protein